MDVASKGLAGQAVENRLESIGIITNRNVIPRDMDNPSVVSGIRLGTGAVTARGMAGGEVAQIAEIMDTAMSNMDNQNVQDQATKEIRTLCERFPVYR